MGHFEGMLLSIAFGIARIEDPRLHFYYDHLIEKDGSV